jgi:hypothetical protein
MIIQSDNLKEKTLLGDLDLDGIFLLITHYLTMSDNYKKSPIFISLHPCFTGMTTIA